ncbi:MAG: heme o synthase [Planctomycetes bacterium]|nr:heme o synthase [Planctomycetota bacterium]
MHDTVPQLNPWQTRAHRLAWVCVSLALFLIAVGAIVTTTRAGDTNPGWSWRFWEWFATWWQSDGGRAWEDGHRVIGTLVGFAGIGLAVSMYRGNPGRPRRWLGLIALALISLQGLIGGLRVLVVSDPTVQNTVLDFTGGGFDVELRRAVKAMIHGITAQVIFAALCCTAVLTSRRWLADWAATRAPAATASRWLAGLAVVLAVVQLGLGTYVRQTGHGVLWHIAGATLVAAAIIATALRIMRHHPHSPLRRTAWATCLLLCLQVFLGLTPYLLTGGDMYVSELASAVGLMRSAHVVCGALILALLSVQALWLFRLTATPEGMRHSKAQDFEAAAAGLVRDLAALGPARLSALVMVTVAAGYFLAAPGMPNVVILLATMLGVSLVAGGTGALNQYLERDLDARMERTRNRPLPSGRMRPGTALALGLGTVAVGTALVALWVNLLAAALTLATTAIYLGIYTPLKTRTTANTLVGAVPGALPPVIGWVAATGRIQLGAFVLFAILYVWQLPHFWSIAWLYRNDYRRGGMRMLSVVDEEGGLVARQIAVWCVALLLTSLLPVLVGMASPKYGVGALVLGLAFLAAGLVHARRRTPQSTRGVFYASLLYLPALLAALLMDVW